MTGHSQNSDSGSTNFQQPNPKPSSSAKSCGAELAQKPSWDWLQAKIDSRPSDPLSSWIDTQLDLLEESFEHLVTPKSRKRSLRKDIESDSQRS